MANLVCTGPNHAANSAQPDWSALLGTSSIVGVSGMWCSACIRLNYSAPILVEVEMGVPGTPIPGSNWSVEHTPAAATLATVTKAAPGVGKRLIVTNLHASLDTTVATRNSLNVRLTEVNSAVTLWRQGIVTQALIGSIDHVNNTGLAIVVSENDGIIWRFSAAGLANSFETVSMGGYIVQL